MAHRTIEQKDVQTELVEQYGKPEFIRLEYTREPYGILWMSWKHGTRNLFIKPNGERLSWDTITT